MKFIKTALFCLFIFRAFAFGQNSLPADSMSNYLNKVIAVKGTVTQVSTPKSGVVYLNIDGRYPDNKLAGVILKRDVEKFTDVKALEGKIVEITGKLQEYKGRLEIVLTSPEQVKVIDGEKK